jgi:hypothetical protein
MIFMILRLSDNFSSVKTIKAVLLSGLYGTSFILLIGRPNKPKKNALTFLGGF